MILNLIFATFERNASFFQPAHSQTRSRFRETEKISYFQIIQRCHGVLRPNQNKNQNCIHHFFVQISHSEVHNEAFLANLFNGRRSEAAGAFCERATSFSIRTALRQNQRHLPKHESQDVQEKLIKGEHTQYVPRKKGHAVRRAASLENRRRRRAD